MNTTADRLEALQSAMYAVCLRVLRHAQDAEDACQEALIEAARQAHDVREDFDAWARRVALTTALDCRRRRDRRRVHETRVRPAAAPAREPVEIDHALAALDEPSRRAVAAHYLDGRPVRELAREAGVSEVAIWKRLVKARGKLRLLFTAALPAAIIGAAVLLVLLRHPAVAPESPATPREEPWPWEMPPRGWPEPVRTTWTALQTRATVESDGMPMREVLDMIAGLIGRPIAVSPDLAGERVSLQVVRTAAEGILRLMLEPRGAGYAIRDDGTIDVARKDALDRALRDRTQSPDVQAALNLRFVSDRIGDARPRPMARAREDFAKPVRAPEGERTLEDYLARLREASGANLLLDHRAATPDLLALRMVGRGEEASLETHLRRIPAPLVPMPTHEGVVLLMRPDDAAELRSSRTWRDQNRLEEGLERVFDGPDVRTFPQFVRRLERALDAPVRATREAWESATAVAPKPGETGLHILERLRAEGFRWAVADGVLYLAR